MKIPKKIHYVWGYNEPKSFLARACIASWSYHMPDYEICEWNENTICFDQLAEECVFFREVYKRKLWAFVADYIRLKVLYEHGGIYLDTDMQIFQSLDPFLTHQLFAGFHDGYGMQGQPSTAYVEGALLGAVPKHPFVASALRFFRESMHKSSLTFLPHILTPILQKQYGLSSDNEMTVLRDGIQIYPCSYFFPLRGDEKAFSHLGNDHYSIHWFRNSYANNICGVTYLYTRHLKGVEKILRSMRIIGSKLRLIGKQFTK